jgi:hypothetical protein
LTPDLVRTRKSYDQPPEHIVDARHAWQQTHRGVQVMFTERAVYVTSRLVRVRLARF